MKYLVLCLMLVACGKDMTAPVQPPPGLPPHTGILRFTLGNTCPSATLLFGVDIFLFGPEKLEPGKSFDYELGEGSHVTSAKTLDNSQHFPQETLTVVAGQSVVRTLSC